MANKLHKGEKEAKTYGEFPGVDLHHGRALEKKIHAESVKMQLEAIDLNLDGWN